MQDQLNKVIDDFNRGGSANRFPHWDMTKDSSQPDFSFMNCILSFSQFLDGESKQNPKIHS
jgi:hypothetical protein